MLQPVARGTTDREHFTKRVTEMVIGDRMIPTLCHYETYEDAKNEVCRAFEHVNLSPVQHNGKHADFLTADDGFQSPGYRQAERPELVAVFNPYPSGFLRLHHIPMTKLAGDTPGISSLFEPCTFFFDGQGRMNWFSFITVDPDTGRHCFRGSLNVGTMTGHPDAAEARWWMKRNADTYEVESVLGPGSVIVFDARRYFIKTPASRPPMAVFAKRGGQDIRDCTWAELMEFTGPSTKRRLALEEPELTPEEK